MAEPKWLQLAREDLWLREIPGDRHEAKIVQFFKDVGHSWVKNDETAWCAAFLGSCLERAGIKSTRKLNARSYLDWGTPLEKPLIGCIAVFSRGDKAWQGHTGFYVGETPGQISVLGGNQTNAVTVTKISKQRWLGYRWPSSMVVVRPPKVGRPGKPTGGSWVPLVFLILFATAAAFVVAKIAGVF